MLYLDQGVGVGHAQVENLGYGWTWLSNPLIAPDPDTISRRVRINRTLAHSTSLQDTILGSVRINRGLAHDSQISRTLEGDVRINRTIESPVERN